MSGIKEKVVGLSKSDVRFLNAALEVAGISNLKQRHGAVIVKGGKIVTFGFNTSRNLSVTDLPGNDYTYHAEHNAIKTASREVLQGSRLYVARLSRRGLPALSRPCDYCMNTILRAGIKEIIYSVSSPVGKKPKANALDKE